MFKKIAKVSIYFEMIFKDFSSIERPPATLTLRTLTLQPPGAGWAGGVTPWRTLPSQPLPTPHRGEAPDPQSGSTF